MTFLVFQKALQERNIELTDRMCKQLEIYARYLKEYNEKVNLTAITDYEEVLDKHFYDSLLLYDRKLEGTFVDVGTGAGFPGVVLKIVIPDLKVILLEPIGKRCVFLNSLIEKLDLKDIEVVQERGEDHSLNHREAYDYVTARAVSNLNSLIEVCGAMVKKEGYFICLRGKDGLEELKTASKAIEKMGFFIESTKEEKLMNGDARVISYLKKVKETPLKYPRKYNIIKKNPL
ncbi:MAG: 16S rRNA (guanine(527)-N(7))-methyltransferase RsmG [Erysipelotrichaceae bacterium]|nr:16S rRNA (guanine(527)-N(7))-methyltransferase RsmG [Erysipelotrichaceae bacterium]